MDGGRRLGKLTWLPTFQTAVVIVRDHPNEIEADLQRFYQIDYRDRWRGTLPYRRLLVLLDALPVESQLKSAVENRPASSREEVRLVEMWESWSGKKHPLRSEKSAQHARDKALEQAEERAESNRELEKQRAAAREHNRRVLERRRKKER